MHSFTYVSDLRSFENSSNDHHSQAPSVVSTPFLPAHGTSYDPSNPLTLTSSCIGTTPILTLIQLLLIVGLELKRLMASNTVILGI